jgi:NADPH-dependent 2,4-dienoyl-CoA reductase/sulfur reductase-like enzyme
MATGFSAAAMASLPQMMRDAGVDLRTGVSVKNLHGDTSGHVRSATLSDGTVLDVDVVVPSQGSIRNVEWLDGAGLAAGQWGVGCDAGCRAFDINGVVTDHIFVAGDVARAPHVLYGYEFLALEHWDNAVSGAEVAANNMINLEVGRRAHLPLPSFWSIVENTLRTLPAPGCPQTADRPAGRPVWQWL